MEKLQLEWQLLGTPDGLLGAEADAAIVVVIDVLKIIRKRCIRLLVRFTRQLLRKLAHDVGVKWLLGLGVCGTRTKFTRQHRKRCRTAGKKASPIQKKLQYMHARGVPTTTSPLGT